MEEFKKNEEQEFHDRKIRGEVQIAPHYKYSVTSFAVEKFLEVLGDVRNKNILEIGCGDGWLTRILIEKGACVTAIDISRECIKQTKAYLEKTRNFKNVTLIHSSLEELTAGDNSFDLVIGNAVLHHMDIPVATDVIYSLLRQSGKGIFLEPLGINILLNFYRLLTPQYRTKSEKPLNSFDFRIIATKFDIEKRVGFYLLSLPFLYLTPFLAKNSFSLTLQKWITRFDYNFINYFKVLIYYSWYNLFVCKKKL